MVFRLLSKINDLFHGFTDEGSLIDKWLDKARDEKTVGLRDKEERGVKYEARDEMIPGIIVV